MTVQRGGHLSCPELTAPVRLQDASGHVLVLENGANVTKAQDFTLVATGRISVIKNLTNAVSLDESINHYAGGSDSPAWTETKTRANAATGWTSAWTRNIASLSGDLALLQASDGTARIQLANLHGDTTIGGTTIGLYTETTEYGIMGPKKPGYLVDKKGVNAMQYVKKLKRRSTRPGTHTAVRPTS